MRPPTRVWWTGGLLGGGPGVPGSSVELIGGLLCLRLSDRNRDSGGSNYMAFRRRRATPASVASTRGRSERIGWAKLPAAPFVIGNRLAQFCPPYSPTPPSRPSRDLAAGPPRFPSLR